MTGLNSRLRQARHLYFYSRFSGSPGPLLDRCSSLRRASGFLSICLQRLSWAGLLRAMLCGAGLIYTTTSMLGEYHFARGHSEHQVGVAIDELRKAGSIFPLNYQFRKASAIALSNIALHEENPLWKQAALDELLEALRVDPLSPDLLTPAITFELDLGRDADAKKHYAVFKRVAKASPLNGLVGK